MKLIHDGGFTKEDKETYKEVIHNNVIKSITDLLEAMEHLDIDLDNRENQVFFDLVMSNKDQVNLSSEIVKAIHHLWQDKGVKEAYQKRNEFQLNDSAS